MATSRRRRRGPRRGRLLARPAVPPLAVARRLTPARARPAADALLRRLPGMPPPAPAHPWADAVRRAVVGSARGTAAVISPAARLAPTALSVAASGAFVVAGASSALAGVFARAVVTPVRGHAEDTAVFAVVDGPDGLEVILPADRHTTAPGAYSLTYGQGEHVARIGAIRSHDPRDGTVQRVVEEVYSGDLRSAVRGRLTGFVYPTPADAGLDATDVEVPVPGGVAPAWRIDPGPSAEPRPAEGLWAVMVHGRGARRTEGLRAVPTAQRLGMTSLLVSYRNDGDAPDAEDARYGLGTTEWEDVAAAVRYALDQGARDVVLFGWSMGGAIALQFADRSDLAVRVRGIVLTGPVVDWMDVLRHQARLNRIPEAVGLLGQWLLSNRAGRLATGMAAPVDLRALDWVTRADHVRVPTLILHSEDDEYVPVGPSMALAERNPELVRFVRFTQAGHTREQNVDPVKWDRTVRGFLRAVLAAPRPGRTD
ncbi:alpha/beta hydrolase family protein [Micrococcus lacusdianchii]|uniref:alpha/beta hydrolase family protein n=1 Tax=Micrococcus lacusdianchii TaxID=2915940 RepID=UPI00200544AD|nr:alpha/beta fold hydrolase [Micrococcus sp. JXJ CY 30]